MKMNEMLYALTDFCIEQDDTETADEDTIAAMIGGLLEYCDRRLPNVNIAAERICRYRFLNFGRDDNRILPEDIRNNDVLCEKGIVLCHISRKNLPVGKNTVASGYEVVYDCDENVIRLFYKVTFRAGEVITIYRTEAACFKDFDFFGFYAELTHQLKCSICRLTHKTQKMQKCGKCRKKYKSAVKPA